MLATGYHIDVAKMTILEPKLRAESSRATTVFQFSTARI